ncbi:Predicted dehydrogenase [Mariniphaga anaerophila]|uniref:Predicted dehydrogenase n=1 Tax=Mariniphaga anaerophila TaxID=1484053 RepID=A0A1M5CMQ0_9BACT|nr:Gfo/Idh/MocA family oxidoreductase [Mariniphaga anaerophila]SHF55692.1 Predicted dehydrogenase [Mariniphaga anaerophila]
MNEKLKINRRHFVKTAGIGLAGFPLIANAFTRVAPSDKIRVAHIGTGNMGGAHIRWFAGFPDVETVALCDVDEVRLGKARELLVSRKSSANPDLYSDFRRIIDRKDIDVITCATPDHWHALVAIMAFESGKDVYGEKPLSFSVKEGKVMLESLKKNDRIFQLGTQIHAGDNYHRVAEIIQSGVLGKIHTVRLWKTGGTSGLGFPANETPPKTLDWNMWLGPAPYAEYTPVKCHGTYRSFFDYSGGVFADFWCHIADIMYMSVHPKGLSSIDARGEVPNDGIADTPKWIDVDFKFKDLDVFWTTTPPKVPGAEKMGIGAHFEGEKGTLTCDYENRVVSIGNETTNDVPEVPKTISRSPGHQRNFLDSVKSRQQPESNLEYAREMTLPMHLALISFRLKRKLQWDSVKEEFVNDPVANFLLSREYRSPWSLPVY